MKTITNYVIQTGDIIRLFDAFSATYGGNSALIAQRDSNGQYLAKTFDGTVLPAFPVDTIEFIYTDKTWWEVQSTHCEMWEIAQNNMEVTYDLEEVAPETARILNDQLGDYDY